ncbi:MAG: Hpt domain-containing protein [Lachnospiraceae bacterium]|nr:Hpt domain-containing protein [Lachnospiraceae bacterium]
MQIDEKTMKELVDAGIDMEEASERFMGNMDMVVKFLKKFPADPNYGLLEEALKNREAKKALSASHILKGVCGNLSMNVMHNLFSEQVEHIRANNWEAVLNVMGDIRTEYEKVNAALAKLP